MPDPWTVDADNGRYLVRSAESKAILIGDLTQDVANFVSTRLNEEIAKAKKQERDAIIRVLEEGVKGVGRSLPEKWVRVVEAVAAIRERA